MFNHWQRWYKQQCRWQLNGRSLMGETNSGQIPIVHGNETGMIDSDTPGGNQTSVGYMIICLWCCNIRKTYRMTPLISFSFRVIPGSLLTGTDPSVDPDSLYIGNLRSIYIIENEHQIMRRFINETCWLIIVIETVLCHLTNVAFG